MVHICLIRFLNDFDCYQTWRYIILAKSINTFYFLLVIAVGIADGVVFLIAINITVIPFFLFGSLDFYAKKLQKLLKIYEKQWKNRKALKSITDWISIKMNKKEREWNTICSTVNQRVPGSSPGLGAIMKKRLYFYSVTFFIFYE